MAPKRIKIGSDVFEAVPTSKIRVRGIRDALANVLDNLAAVGWIVLERPKVDATYGGGYLKTKLESADGHTLILRTSTKGYSRTYVSCGTMQSEVESIVPSELVKGIKEFESSLKHD